MSNYNVDYIIEKLTLDKMGKSARKAHKRDIDKCLDLIDLPGNTWNNKAEFSFKSGFDLFSKKTSWFPVLISVIMNDMKPEVKYSLESGLFVFGVKLSSFNYSSTLRIRYDEVTTIQNSLRVILIELCTNFVYYKSYTAKEKGLMSWDDFDDFDKNYYSESFLDDYITEDMKKLIKNFYPTYHEFRYFMDSVGMRGLNNVDNRVNKIDVYKAIGDAVYDYIVRRFVGVKVKDGYFKSLDTEDFFPLFAVDYEKDIIYSNYCFRKTSMKALKEKSDRGDYPRGSYHYNLVLSRGKIWIDYSGLEADILWSSESAVNTRF